jgi:hypothetical protein
MHHWEKSGGRIRRDIDGRAVAVIGNIGKSIGREEGHIYEKERVRKYDGT